MDLPTVPLVTEGAEAEVLLSGWLEKLEPGVGHFSGKSQPKSGGNPWKMGDIMVDMVGESKKIF